MLILTYTMPDKHILIYFQGHIILRILGIFNEFKMYIYLLVIIHIIPTYIYSITLCTVDFCITNRLMLS